MSLPNDLLAQARHLATREKRRPRQASLRRAVSACYYALFHLLIQEASRRLVGGNARTALRHCLGRAFDHSAMNSVATQFARRGVSPKLSPGLAGQPLQDELVTVAAIFLHLQQCRRAADYDMGRKFSRLEALGVISATERAFKNWRTVRGSVPADTFLIGLLAYDKMRR